MKTIQQVQDSFTRIIERYAPYLVALTLLGGTVFLVPATLYTFISSKVFVIDIAMLILLVSVLLAYSFRSLKAIFRSRAVWGVLGFLLIVSISATFGIDPTISWLSHPERGTGVFFMLLVFLGAIATAMILYKTNATRRFLLYPIGIASAILGLSVIIGPSGLALTHNPILLDSNGGGLLGNSSFTGVYLMGAVFVLLYLFLTARSRGRKIFVTILAFFTICNPVIIDYGIFHNGIHGISSIIGDARGATISLGLGMILFLALWLGLSAKRNIKKWLGWALAGVVIGGTVISLILVTLPNTSLHNSFTARAGGNRFVFWQIALEGAKEHPIIGSGPETFRYIFEKYFDPRLMEPDYNFEIWVDKPHNMYFESLATTGVVGLLIYLAMFGLLIYGAIRVYLHSHNRLFLATTLGFIFAYLINNFFVFDTPTSYLLFAAIMAWIASQEMKITSANSAAMQTQNNAKYFILRGVLSLIIIIGALWIIIPEMKKIHYISLEAKSSIAERASWYQKVEAESPYGSGLGFAQIADAYTQWYQANINEVLKRSAEDQQAVLTDIDALTDALHTSLAKYPVTIEGVLSLGRLASVKIAVENKLDPDALARMKDAGTETIKLSPNNPQGYWLLGQAYVFEENYPEALKTFQAALAIDPKVPQSYVVIANLAKLMNDKKLLDATMAEFNTEFPDSSLTQ